MSDKRAKSTDPFVALWVNEYCKDTYMIALVQLDDTRQLALHANGKLSLCGRTDRETLSHYPESWKVLEREQS